MSTQLPYHTNRPPSSSFCCSFSFYRNQHLVFLTSSRGDSLHRQHAAASSAAASVSSSSSLQKQNANNHPTADVEDVTKRAAQLEANNAALHAALSSKNAHIAMLEERILKMSVELASSRAREDEQKLIYRRRATQVQVDNIMSPSEDDNDGDILLQDGLVIPKPVRNTKRTGRLRRRGSSRGSSVSPCSDDQAAADVVALANNESCWLLLLLRN